MGFGGDRHIGKINFRVGKERAEGRRGGGRGEEGEAVGRGGKEWEGTNQGEEVEAELRGQGQHGPQRPVTHLT